MNSICRFKGLPTYQSADAFIQLITPKRTLAGLSSPKYVSKQKEIIGNNQNKIRYAQKTYESGTNLGISQTIKCNLILYYF